MERKRSRAKHSLASAVTVVLALLVAPDTAVADTAVADSSASKVGVAKAGKVPTSLPPGFTDAEFTLTDVVRVGEVGATNAISCTGRSHNPHASSHNPGWVRGQGETTCSAPVTDIHVQPELYEWIPDYGWFLTSIGPGNTQLGVTTVRASAEDLCPDQPIYFATRSYHRVTFPAGYSPPSGSGWSSSAAVSVVC